MLEVLDLLNHVDWLKGQRSRVGFWLGLAHRPRGLQALLSHSLRGITELVRPVNRFAKQRHWNHAVAIHIEHWARRCGGNGLNPIGPRWQRKEISDDATCRLAERLHHRWAMAFSCHVQRISKPCFSGSFIHVDSRIKQHGVMAQRGVWIAFIDAMIDQQRQVVLGRNMPSDFDGWILMKSEG